MALTPVIVSDLFPDLSRLSSNREVPIVRAVSQRNVFDRVPEVLPEIRIPQKAPILVLAQQLVTAIRDRGSGYRIRLGARWHHGDEEARGCDDWKHAYANRIHFCNKLPSAESPRSS